MTGKDKTKRMARRDFLTGAAAAATFTIIKPALVRGAEANSKIELGMIGCGGRGNWIMNLFNKRISPHIFSFRRGFT